MEIICPNFNAAPRILDNFLTSLSILSALNINDPAGVVASEDDEAVALRNPSLNAPNPIPAANPP
jgi:hypothetical protein